MKENLEKIINWGIAVLVFLLPLFFLPLTTDFFDFNKNILLFFACGLLLIIWVLKTVLEKRVVFKKTPFDLPVLFFAVAFLVSTFAVKQNRAEAFILSGGTETILALTIFYFLITNLVTNGELIITSLLASAAFLAVVNVFSFLEFAKVWNLTLPEWLSQKTFSLAGGPLPSATFLGVALLLLGTRIWAKWKNEKQGIGAYWYLLIFLVFVLGGLGTSLYLLFTSARPILLPLKAGWQIAIETLKFSPFLGVGPTSFIVAFNQFRPLNLNLSDLWTFKFWVSSNWYFQLLTTTGILGLAAFLWLVWQVIKTSLGQKNTETNTEKLGIFATFLFIFFLPANFLALFTLYLLLALLGKKNAQKEYLEESRILPWLILFLLLPSVLFAFYFVGRAYAGEIYFKRSLDALSENKGTETYNFQIKAITLAPYRVQYRLAYSQTNLALANALAQKPNLSDQDRANISILVQQAIREAKAAVALDPRNSISWENLAGIYRALINFAEGAESWTISTFQQAIALDPTNPQLRLSLGGIYYSLQNWEEAIKRFEEVVTLKPNFANGHYNLAAAYREKGDFEKAAQEMEITLSLVPKDSEDFRKAESELEAIKKRLGEKAEKEGKKPSETLTQPEPLPTGIKPPLTLPSGVEPEISPTPSPTPFIPPIPEETPTP